MDRHLFESQLLSRLVPSVADDDHAVFIDDDGLAESKLTDRSCDDIDSLIIQTWIVFIRMQLRELPLFDLHGTTFPEDKGNGKGRSIGRWGDQLLS